MEIEKKFDDNIKVTVQPVQQYRSEQLGGWIWNTLDATLQDHLKKYPDWEGKIKFGPPKDNGKKSISPEKLSKMSGVYFLVKK